MKVILFGATGMVGQAALRECLLDAGVKHVLTVGRSATGQKHEKLQELVHADLTDYSRVSGELAGGTTDHAVAAGRALVAANPG